MSAELAWVAGIFEGEGSIINTSAGGRMQRRLVIQMTDKDVLDRVADIVGGSVFGPTLREGYKPIWVWRVSRWCDIERVLLAMLPWLCERRRAAAVALLANPAGPVGSPPKLYCKRGHPRVGPDADIYIHPKTGTAHCRPCRLERLQT